MRKRKQNKDKLRIIPLGGLDGIGMNMTAFEYNDSIIVVDCGLAFPEDDMPGVDFVIPDITYLKENAERSGVLSSRTDMKTTSALCPMFLRTSRQRSTPPS